MKIILAGINFNCMHQISVILKEKEPLEYYANLDMICKLHIKYANLVIKL